MKAISRQLTTTLGRRARRLWHKVSPWVRRVVWTVFWFGVPIVFVVTFVIPTAQGPVDGNADEPLSFSFEGLPGREPMQVNVDYSASVLPGAYDSYENVSLWWYAAERVSAPGTTTINVYAEGTNDGADWSCKAGFLPPINEWDRYLLSSYPDRATHEYPERISSNASTTASIKVSSDEVTDEDLVTAGRLPERMQRSVEPTLDVRPAPSATADPTPESPLPIQAGISVTPTPSPPIAPLIESPPLTRSQYQLVCQRWLQADIENAPRVRLGTPDITFYGDAFVTSVHATASVAFSDDWPLASPVSAFGETYDQPRAGLVTFEYHEVNPTVFQFGDNGNHVFGSSFVAANPDGERHIELFQQFGLLAGAAWLAILGGALAPILLTFPFRFGARGGRTSWNLVPVPQQDVENLRQIVEDRQSLRRSPSAPPVDQLISDLAYRAVFDQHTPWPVKALARLAKSSTVTTVRFIRVMDLCAESPGVLHSAKEIHDTLGISAKQWERTCRRITALLPARYRDVPRWGNGEYVGELMWPLVGIPTPTTHSREPRYVGITIEQARRWKSVR